MLSPSTPCSLRITTGMHARLLKSFEHGILLFFCLCKAERITQPCPIQLNFALHS